MGKARLVIGLGFGDEGKGSVVDYLVRRTGSKLVVRFNGGSQAAHNVVDDRGVHHCFSQFGSGSFVPGVRTYLSRFVMVNPFNVLNEAAVLSAKIGEDPLPILMIDNHCPITTLFHSSINKMKELVSGSDRKGSCGKGVGETIKDAERLGEEMLFAGDLGDLEITYKKLKFIHSRKLDLAEQLVEQKPLLVRMPCYKFLKGMDNDSSLRQMAREYQVFALDSGVKIVQGSEYLPYALAESDVVFEGAQGVLLDVERGFWPYVTLSTTTFANALTVLEEAKFSGEVEKIGVIRAYANRHGPGPFPSRDKKLEAKIPDDHNIFNEWQRSFCVGWFDVPLARYALKACGGVDSLAITNLDRLSDVGSIKVVEAYGPKSKNSRMLKKFLSDNFDALNWVHTTTPERQKCLGDILSICLPVTKIVAENVGRKNFQRYVNLLEEKLGKKASILSFGPRPSDKLKIV